LTISRLRPNVLFYSEPYLDNKGILEAAKQDLKIFPELVLIISTKFQVPGAYSVAANFCNATRSVGGASFWISKEQLIWKAKSLCDYVLIGDCHQVAPVDILNSPS
jgi:hypothetical protein